MLITFSQLAVFLLILARILGIMLQAPVLGSRIWPFHAKVALGIWIAAALWFVVPIQISCLPTSTGAFMLALISELTIGFLIGFICNLFYVAFQTAGEILDQQMGLSVAQAFDPMFGEQISIVGKFFYYTALTIFLVANGHHLLLAGLYQSFHLLPLARVANFGSPQLVQVLSGATANIFYYGVLLAAPILVMMFLLIDFAFGIVSRVAPQVNVFMLSFQLRPTLGMIGVLLSTPLMIKYLANILEPMGQEMLKLLLALK